MRIIVGLVVAALLALPASAQQFKKRTDKFTAESLVEKLESGNGITASGQVRTHIRIAVVMLKDFEGWEALPYLDSSDYCTVGYGHLIAKKHCSKIDPLPYALGLSEPDGEALLEQDTRAAREGVTSLVTVELTDEQFGALTNFV